jgi:hypothetical protein
MWNGVLATVDLTMEVLTFSAYESEIDVARCGSLYKVTQSDIDNFINTTSYVADLEAETQF